MRASAHRREEGEKTQSLSVPFRNLGCLKIASLLKRLPLMINRELNPKRNRPQRSNQGREKGGRFKIYKRRLSKATSEGDFRTIHHQGSENATMTSEKSDAQPQARENFCFFHPNVQLRYPKRYCGRREPILLFGECPHCEDEFQSRFQS